MLHQRGTEQRAISLGATYYAADGCEVLSGGRLVPFPPRGPQGLERSRMRCHRNQESAMSSITAHIVLDAMARALRYVREDQDSIDVPQRNTRRVHDAVMDALSSHDS